MKKKRYDINYKYFIILFFNRKKRKLIHKSAKRTTIMEMWSEIKTQDKPPYVKLFSGRNHKPLTVEMGLIYPKTRWSTKTYVKDELGRNLEAKINNEKQRIKYIIPYWVEETIYDFDSKINIRYHEMMKYILTVNEIAQIFTLNNKLFVQVEDNIKMYGNKNISDTSRLFEIVRNDLIERKKNNFIFVKDITSHQRTFLYDLLEKKGYKRTELFRHYSY